MAKKKKVTKKKVVKKKATKKRPSKREKQSEVLLSEEVAQKMVVEAGIIISTTGLKMVGDGFRPRCLQEVVLEVVTLLAEENE